MVRRTQQKTVEQDRDRQQYASDDLYDSTCSLYRDNTALKGYLIITTSVKLHIILPTKHVCFQLRRVTTFSQQSASKICTQTVC